MAQGVVRAGESAMPGGSYMLKQLPMPMVGLSEQVLFSPGLDGTARVPVINDSEVGVAFDEGDLIAMLTIPDPVSSSLRSRPL